MLTFANAKRLDFTSTFLLEHYELQTSTILLDYESISFSFNEDFVQTGKEKKQKECQQAPLQLEIAYFCFGS